MSTTRRVLVLSLLALKAIGKECAAPGTKDDFRPDLAGTYKSIVGLRIDPSRVSGHHLFWVKDWVQLIASEAIKDAFKREGIVGAKFTPV